MGYCKLLGGGITIGKYVWRKNEITRPEISVMNPTFTLTNKGYTAPITNTLTTESVNFKLVENFQEFLDGVKAVGDSSVYFINRSDGLSFVKDDAYYGVFDLTVVSENTITFETGGSALTDKQMAFEGKKIVQSVITNPIGFVIGNNPEQYPTDGEKGGYWYELIGQITSTNALSLTDDVTNLVKDIAVEEIKQEVITNVD